MSRAQLVQEPTGAGEARAVVSDDRIRQRAYEKFCRRGSAPGDPVGDWLEAERELRAAARIANQRPSNLAPPRV